MSNFDWKGLLSLAVQLGLRPAEFWSLTPAEFELYLGTAKTAEPMNRLQLDDLLANFPDKSTEIKNG